MARSELQEPFLSELAHCFHVTANRIVNRVKDASEDQRNEIVRDELRGLYHGVLVVLDGGTSLADRGLIQIVDERGNRFDRNLHEIGFQHWPNDA